MKLVIKIKTKEAWSVLYGGYVCATHEAQFCRTTRRAVFCPSNKAEAKDSLSSITLQVKEVFGIVTNVKRG